MLRDMNEFDQEHAAALRGLWFLGDVHGEFKYVARALVAAEKKPDWLIFLGDIECNKPFKEILAPLTRNFPETRVAFIPGNHDSDDWDLWANLMDCGDSINLHGRVVALNGIRVAGLGGNFLGRIWSPPGDALFRNKQAAMNRGAYQWRDGQRPHPKHHSAIYPDDVEHLAKLRADILVSHEAPSCHQYGFDAIDDLSRDLRVVRTFHGHHHDDPSDHYATLREDFGFDPRAVAFCAIKNGLGEAVFEGSSQKSRWKIRNGE